VKEIFFLDLKNPALGSSKKKIFPSQINLDPKKEIPKMRVLRYIEILHEIPCFEE